MSESAGIEKESQTLSTKPAGEIKTSTESEDSRKKSFDLGPAMELVKNIGVVIGGLGSLAVLLFWIGKAIIVARLRAYNLYGLVHYTDEYVTEAGYQFLHDIFTFFQRPELILLFILATALLIMLIPVGPFSPRETGPISKENIRKNPFVVLEWIRNKRLHYLLFLAMAISASTFLTGQWGVRNLSSLIMTQERLLYETSDTTKQGHLFFIPREKGSPNEFQRRFNETLTMSEVPTTAWLERSLREFYFKIDPGIPNDIGLAALIERFQKDFDIKETSGFDLTDKGVENSETYKKLRSIRLSDKLNDKLYTTIDPVLRDVRELLSAHLKSEEDVSSFLVIPANYEVANNSLARIKLLVTNILASYQPKNEEAVEVMAKLSKIKPIHFGSVLLIYTFWILIGLLVYLIINTLRILKFRQWEMGYFFIVLSLFLIIAIALPTAYGRYKFEFSIQKLNEVIFASETKGDRETNPVQDKLNELSKSATLYILGPTKGKEVIVGAIRGKKEAGITTPEIIVLERDTCKYMSLEPVQLEDIPEIIKMLRYGKSSGKTTY